MVAGCEVGPSAGDGDLVADVFDGVVTVGLPVAVASVAVGVTSAAVMRGPPSLFEASSHQIADTISTATPSVSNRLTQ